MSELNAAGGRLAASLELVEQARQADRYQYELREKKHIVGAGRALSGAYEQLRNAAENTDEALFMQRAIRRFFRRLFLNANDADLEASGEELVTELTLAGYIANDSITTNVITEISELAQDYYSAYEKLERFDDSERSGLWTIDVLAVEVALLLAQQDVRDVFLQFGFETFLKTIDWQSLFPKGAPEDYELLLYVALHRALLRSDDATVRRYLLYRFQRSPKDYPSFITSNRQIDELMQRPALDRLTRLVSRHGAGMRVLGAMLRQESGSSASFANKSQFLRDFESQIDSEYDSLQARIRRGVTKSIVFLVITKLLIGVAGEVPYDIIVYGSVVWLPLVINFLAPVLYIVSVGATLEAPGPANTAALIRQMDSWLYRDVTDSPPIRSSKQRHSTVFNTIYAVVFVLVFGLVSWGLVSIGYDVVHLLVFFLFFSAASFLGFRLARSVRELEAVDQGQSGLTVLRDFIYMPFIVVGQKINQEYAKVNIVGSVLDVVIEMPLKSTLRFVRQWSAFVSSKKDEL